MKNRHLNQRLVFYATDDILVMIASHVTVVRRVRGERAPAMSAFEWLLAAVLTDMSAQNGRSSEAFHAVRASVWLLSAVNPQVLVETRRLRETFPAFCTLVWTIFFMYVQNVNA